MSNEIEKIFSSVLETLSDEFKEKLTNWGKIVQVNIDGDVYYINFADGLNLHHGSHDSRDFTISSSIETFSGIINGTLNPVDAVVSGDVSIDGSLTIALEFSELIQSVRQN